MVWWTKSPSSLLNIYLALSKANMNTYFSFSAKCWLRGGVGSQFPRNVLIAFLTPICSLPVLTVRLPVYTVPKCDTEPRQYVTLHFLNRRGAAPPRYVTEMAPKSPFFWLFERKPYTVFVRRKSYSVYIVWPWRQINARGQCSFLILGFLKRLCHGRPVHFV